ncbi:MAG: ribosome maturation factor RimM [candidate division KSB1 bacterium]|nr:ribosome maturation factor RimM [candidate division KSB1 bacterium]
MRPDGLVAVGRLTRPHGLRGELVFLPYVYDLELLPDLVQRQVFLQQRQAPVQTAILLEWRVANKRVLVRLQGCQDVDDAEALRECEVLIPRSWFPLLPAGEYYWFEIEGLAVYAHDGRYLGTIVELIHTGSNDVYVARHGTQETLIPALRDVVRTIDLERGAMHLYPVPGLLD